MFLRRSAVGSVKDPATGELVEKMVFVVFYAGERARQKILKAGGEGRGGEGRGGVLQFGGSRRVGRGQRGAPLESAQPKA